MNVIERLKSIPRILRSALVMMERFEPHQVMALLVLFLLTGGLLAFIGIADEFLESDTLEFDRAVLRFFRTEEDPARLKGPDFVFETVRDITSLGGVGVLTLVVLMVSSYLVLQGRRRLFLLLVIATIGGVVLTVLLKGLFGRVRPDIVPALVEQGGRSFPSGHSSMSAVVYLTVGSILASSRPKMRVRIYIFSMAFLVSLLVGLTRVMLGIHYPTDVLAGWSLGLAWASLCWFAALIIRYRRRIFPWVRGEALTGDLMENGPPKEDRAAGGGSG